MMLLVFSSCRGTQKPMMVDLLRSSVSRLGRLRLPARPRILLRRLGVLPGVHPRLLLHLQQHEHCFLLRQEMSCAHCGPMLEAPAVQALLCRPQVQYVDSDLTVFRRVLAAVTQIHLAV